jgi:hypothetical protein
MNAVAGVIWTPIYPALNFSVKSDPSIIFKNKPLFIYGAML